MIMEAIRGTTDFVPEPERTAEEVLGALQPPEVAERALAKLAIQRVFENFSEAQHIKCASPERPGRTWLGMIRKVRWQQYGDTKGFDAGDYELEAIMNDTDELIWGSDGTSTT